MNVVETHVRRNDFFYFRCFFFRFVNEGKGNQIFELQAQSICFRSLTSDSSLN